ncbi:MAG: fumarate hydratase class II, partial [Colwellia sp.]
NALADKVIKDISVNHDEIKQNLAKNPILVTALTDLIGYEKSAEIAKKAYIEKKTVMDVAIELTDISEAELMARLDPKQLIGGVNKTQ